MSAIHMTTTTTPTPTTPKPTKTHCIINKRDNLSTPSDFLINNCQSEIGLKHDSSALDTFFNQETPYKFPALIICDDSKRINQSSDIYQKYMDVIVDECGNRFNIRNLQSAGNGLQAGYAVNIDLDSHLKNINYYNDKCFYDNWKLAPNSTVLKPCNGLKRNAEILTPDYTVVDRHYNDCLGNCSNVSPCWNTAPSDINCETDVRKRYNFNHHSFQKESCIKPNEWKPFLKGTQPLAQNLSVHPNGKRDQALIDSLNQGVTHDYYNFFSHMPNTCITYPNQRLFNNVTKRSMLPNHHFRNSDPIYKA